MRTFSALVAITTILFISCQPGEKALTAQEIIDKSIEASGVEKISNSHLSFDFRDRTYEAKRNNGVFALKRITKQNDSIITDVLSNNGFE